MLILVSGSTKTVGTLAARWPNHLGHLLTPSNRNSVGSILKTGLRWAVDNGAFSGFDLVAFRRLVRRAAGQPRLLWVVCPDVVADAHRTLELWREHSPWLRASGVPVAFVLQDGQDSHELPDADCYFIGGSTQFKLSDASADLVQEGKRRGRWIHMGRVNSFQRLNAAYQMGCDSIDGSSLSMFGDVYIHKFCSWARQLEEQQCLW